MTKRHFLLLYSMVIAYSLLFSWLAVQRYASGHSNIGDLGAFDHALWQTARGNLLYMSWFGKSIFSYHFSPILLLLALIYTIAPRVELLLIGQTLWLAATAIPLYLLTTKMVRDAWAAPLITAAFLLYPALQNLNRFDFHPVSFTVPTFLWAIYCLETRRKGWFMFFVCLAFLSKEHVPLLGVTLGIYLWMLKREPKLGMALGLLGGLWAFGAVFVVIPFFNGGRESIFLTRISWLGSSYTEIIWTLLTQPRLVLSHITQWPQLRYLVFLFGPLLFLPFLYPMSLFIVAPTLFLNLLADKHCNIAFQYSANLIPWLFWGTVRGVRFLQDLSTPVTIRFSIIALLVAACAGNWRWSYFAPWGRLASALEYTTDENLKAYRAVVKQIPPDDSVTMDQAVYLSPLVHRQQVYLLPQRFDASDWVIFRSGINFDPNSGTDYDLYRRLLEDNPRYTPILRNARFTVFKRDQELPPPIRVAWGVQAAHHNFAEVGMKLSGLETAWKDISVLIMPVFPLFISIKNPILHPDFLHHMPPDLTAELSHIGAGFQLHLTKKSRNEKPFEGLEDIPLTHFILRGEGMLAGLNPELMLNAILRVQ